MTLIGLSIVGFVIAIAVDVVLWIFRLDMAILDEWSQVGYIGLIGVAASVVTTHLQIIIQNFIYLLIWPLFVKKSLPNDEDIAQADQIYLKYYDREKKKLEVLNESIDKENKQRIITAEENLKKKRAKATASLRKALEEYGEHLEKLDAVNESIKKNKIVHADYKSHSVIKTLIKYLEHKRADTLKEAINLFIDETKKEGKDPEKHLRSLKKVARDNRKKASLNYLLDTEDEKEATLISKLKTKYA